MNAKADATANANMNLDKPEPKPGSELEPEHESRCECEQGPEHDHGHALGTNMKGAYLPLQGQGMRTPVSSFKLQRRNKAGTIGMKLLEGDSLAALELVRPLTFCVALAGSVVMILRQGSAGLSLSAITYLVLCCLPTHWQAMKRCLYCSLAALELVRTHASVLFHVLLLCTAEC